MPARLRKYRFVFVPFPALYQCSITSTFLVLLFPLPVSLFLGKTICVGRAGVIREFVPIKFHDEQSCPVTPSHLLASIRCVHPTLFLKSINGYFQVCQALLTGSYAAGEKGATEGTQASPLSYNPTLEGLIDYPRFAYLLSLGGFFTNNSSDLYVRLGLSGPCARLDQFRRNENTRI